MRREGERIVRTKRDKNKRPIAEIGHEGLIRLWPEPNKKKEEKRTRANKKKEREQDERKNASRTKHGPSHIVNSKKGIEKFLILPNREAMARRGGMARSVIGRNGIGYFESYVEKRTLID